MGAGSRGGASRFEAGLGTGRGDEGSRSVCGGRCGRNCVRGRAPDIGRAVEAGWQSVSRYEPDCVPAVIAVCRVLRPQRVRVPPRGGLRSICLAQCRAGVIASVSGEGPVFECCGGRVGYTREDLDAWALA